MLPPDQLHEWLSIRLVPDMNRARFYALMNQFPTAADVFGASAAAIAAVRGFNPHLATEVLASNATDRARRHLDRMLRADIRIVTRQCEEYPFNLRHSTLAPPLLFVRGTLNPDDKYSVALVGSRHATTYGRSVARELAGDLARFGLTIVSGFARGIDGEAHHAAVRAGGRTLAILGNGLDICYPSEHHGLVDEVTGHGAMITEYPLGTPPERYNFPERNHVIAALALGTIVVEAAEKSGSLITSRLALDENRFVFAVPGDITRQNSRGANRLIQNGACMVQRAKDVLIEMKDVLRGYLNVDQLTTESAPQPQIDLPPPAERRSHKSHDWVDDLEKVDPTEFEKLVAEMEAAPPAQLPPVEMANAVKTDDTQPAHQERVQATVPPQQPFNRSKPPSSVVTAASTSIISMDAVPPSAKYALSEEERFITELLYHEAMVFDELADRAFNRGIDVPRLTSMLLKLEMKKIIRQLPGRYYVLFT